jgi:hypothetical protein
MNQEGKRKMRTRAQYSILALVVVSFLGLNLAWGADSQAISSWKPYTLSLEEKLRSAACWGDVQGMSRLLAQGAQLDAADFDGWTALMWAATQDRPDAVRLLLERGANVNSRSKTGQTALSAAAMNGHAEVMAILVERGAKLEVLNERGWTPLMEASARGHLDAVKLLVASGANPNFKGKKGAHALSLAGFYEHAHIAEVLLSQGAYPDKETQRRLVSLGITRTPARQAEQMTVVQYSNRTEHRGPTRIGDSAVRPGLPTSVVEAYGQAGMGGVSLDRRNAQPYRVSEAYMRVPVSVQSVDPVQSLENAIRTSGASRRSDRYVQAESLLRQGIEIWNRLRTEYPDVARRLQEAAGR